jgi:hypothetical protein
MLARADIEREPAAAARAIAAATRQDDVDRALRQMEAAAAVRWPAATAVIEDAVRCCAEATAALRATLDVLDRAGGDKAAVARAVAAMDAATRVFAVAVAEATRIRAASETLRMRVEGDRVMQRTDLHMQPTTTMWAVGPPRPTDS